MAKSRQRLQARELRRRGESIREVAKKVGVSKSSASLWCRDIELTQEQVEILKQRDVVGGMPGRMKAWEWHREEKRKRYTHFHNIGYRMFNKLNNQSLFLVGLALYWSEGSKKDHRVLLTNSDPTMILIYIFWLERCLGVKRNDLVCRLAINEAHTHRRKKIEAYWSNITHIPLTQFTQTVIIHSKWCKKYENPESYFGILAVHVRKSTDLTYQICGGIDRLREFSKLMVQ